MKTNVLLATLTAVSLAFSGLAFAQGRDGRPGPDNRPGASQRGGPPGHQGMPKPGMHQPPRGPGPQGHPGAKHQRPPQDSNAEGRGAGPDHNFYRGGRLPRDYRSNQYVVNDWRGHHLNAPPRGYHWVQTGGDYVLVAIGTGIIAQIYIGQ